MTTLPALLSVFLAAPAAAQPARLPPGARLSLPRAAGVEAGWIAPPSETLSGGEAFFTAAPDGAAWLVLDGEVVAVPGKDALFAADRPLQQWVWFDGKPVVRSFESLGTLSPAAPSGAGIPRARFVPLAAVPLTSWRIAPAGKRGVLVWGYNPRKRVSQIALAGEPLRVLYSGEARITAAAGDGERVYFAAGPAIWTLAADGTATVYRRAARTIRELRAAPGGGVFYADDAGVGFAGPGGAIEFLRGRNCRIETAGDDLFVLLGGPGRGLLRLRGVSRLAAQAQGAIR